MKILLTAAFAILSLISVAQPGGDKSPDSTFIYIYRAGQFSGSLANWTIFVDEQKICKLSNNRFIRLMVRPGKHVVSAKLSGVSVFKKGTEVEIDAENGNNYFVACNIKSSITRTRLEMIEVTKSTGVKQMEHMVLDNCQEGTVQ